MNRRFMLLTLALGVAMVLGAAANAHACFGLLNRCNSCCEPSCCAEEPSCCAEEASCCDPCCRPRLLGRLRGMFNRCCEPSCCCEEPSCCAEEAAPAAEPSCCAEEASCCDPCCRPRLLGRLRGMFNRCCEPSCCCEEPSCGCGA